MNSRIGNQQKGEKVTRSKSQRNRKLVMNIYETVKEGNKLK